MRNRMAWRLTHWYTIFGDLIFHWGQTKITSNIACHSGWDHTGARANTVLLRIGRFHLRLHPQMLSGLNLNPTVQAIRIKHKENEAPPWKLCICPSCYWVASNTRLASSIQLQHHMPTKTILAKEWTTEKSKTMPQDTESLVNPKNKNHIIINGEAPIRNYLNLHDRMLCSGKFPERLEQRKLTCEFQFCGMNLKKISTDHGCQQNSALKLQQQRDGFEERTLFPEIED